MKNIMDSLLGLYEMMEKDFGEDRKKTASRTGEKLM